MVNTLLLLDYENVPKVDLSVLDEGYRAVIFVGRNQEPPKAFKSKQTAHRFVRVDFQKIEGSGKNALDFHIAFHLGRLFETSPSTECVVIAGDKGYDPLLAHLNKSGMKCRRVASWDELVSERATFPAAKVGDPSETAAVTSLVRDPDLTVCPKCKKTSTIEHHGGRWCSNCGSFAVAPDPNRLPSAQPGFRRNEAEYRKYGSGQSQSRLVCSWCHQRQDMTDGIYDDGEWMCGYCVVSHMT